MEKKILLDTNFLVAPFQLSLDVFDELERHYPHAEIYTLDDVVQEAKSIESGKYIELVEKLLDTQDIEVLETEDEEASYSHTVEGEEVDDLLIELCDDFVVATNDKELKERLLEKDAEVVIIRGKNYLEILNQQELR